MVDTILYCADPLAPRRVEGHFASEAASARQLGVRVVLIDHDAAAGGDAEGAVRRVPAGLGAVWYRGWMLTAGAYRRLDAALAGRGARLATGPADYQRAHEFPGWYPAFQAVTPPSVSLESGPGQVPTADRLAALAAPLGGGPGMVKDYVKSRKHEWDEACFVPDLADRRTLHRIVARMIELQEGDLTGGIVVRAFETFIGDGARPSEARVWWLDGVPVLAGAHPDSPESRPEPNLDAVAPAVAVLGCRLVTTDLALRDDGTWRVVEVGDGQVSDLPAGADPTPLLSALRAA